MPTKQIPAISPLNEAPEDDDRFVLRDTSSGSDVSLRVDRLLERSADQVSAHSDEEGGIHGIPEGERALHTPDDGLPSNIVLIYESGTYTPPSDVRAIVVHVVGAGGGSGAADSTGSDQNAESGAGGGGGYAKKLIEVQGISSATVAVGIGGIGGNGDGSSGGDSSWDDGTHILNAGGGGGGAQGGPTTGSNRALGGVGGGASGGDVNISGASGGNGRVLLGARVSANYGGASARSPSCIAGGDVPETPPNAPGAGASGAGNGTNEGGKDGADGNDGIVIVWEYK